jgi:hypothetical protein
LLTYPGSFAIGIVKIVGAQSAVRVNGCLTPVVQRACSITCAPQIVERARRGRRARSTFAANEY